MTAQKPPSACQTVLWIDRHAHCGEFCGDWSVAESSRVHYHQVVINGLTIRGEDYERSAVVSRNFDF